jgi:uncharacterized membrane protein YoaK (UPF0700 family)
MSPLRRTYLLASFNWFLLSFLAGNVNAGGFLSCQRFVSHITGFSTLFGIEYANGDFDKAAGILSVPAFFILGAMLSAYLIDRPFHRGKTPHYATVIGLVSLCIFAACLGGHLGFFGIFGESLRLKSDYFLLALLCAASGLQNAAITTSSGAAVRTTHLTGITTDLAIGLVRAQAKSKESNSFKREMRSNWIRIGTIFSFTLGSVVGALCFRKWQYLGFILPASIAFYEMLIALKFKSMFSTKHLWVSGYVGEKEI